MIRDIPSFIRYFDGVRRRTLTFARAIPPERIDWAPRPDEFTFGDLLRHLAAIEKISVQAVVAGRWGAYPGHGPELAPDLEAAIACLQAVHAEAMEQLAALPDEVLRQPRPDLTGQTLKAWRLLMAMLEHEIHHRSQIASYLADLGLEPPQIYGLHVEDVVELSARQAEAGR